MILNYMIIVNTGILGHPLQNKYMCALKKNKHVAIYHRCRAETYLHISPFSINHY